MSGRSWWKANAVALGMLVVLLPAGAVAIGWKDWTAANSTAFNRVTPVIASDGETVELSGATWGPIRSAAIHDTEGMTTPPNTRVIGVAIPVKPDPVDPEDPSDPVKCNSPLIIEQSTGRQWNESSFELGFDYSSTEYRECDSTVTEPYEIIVPFAIPEDAEGPFWIDVVPYNGFGKDGELLDPDEGGTGVDGRFVRFEIDPS
ncbi:hypothetical protein [Microbacterium esteraromaticum]|uniref:hypothetical protein n=1 Tax=Microbacterium esteraromaticum TaxID=57043 RepID=UPI00195786DD|nr:hypothetical protein [Microbacterium esteraromaticum]MBM7465659.1 hypothetical protein [Microbacterium esteraromaticum]